MLDVSDRGARPRTGPAAATATGEFQSVVLRWSFPHERCSLPLDLIGDKTLPVYQAHARLVLIPPTRLFAPPEGLHLKFGNEEVVVFWPGPSQAPDKVVVYFPERRLLFGGCMILGKDRIGNVADADVSQWPDAVRALARFPADMVVPGHGERLDPQLEQHTLDLLQRRAGRL